MRNTFRSAAWADYLDGLVASGSPSEIESSKP
jgi:hypothetical protein